MILRSFTDPQHSPQSTVANLFIFNWRIVTLKWASLIAQLAKNLPAMQETQFNSWVGKIPWRREWLPTPVFWPGEFHGLYSPWGGKELDTTGRLSRSLYFPLALLPAPCSLAHHFVSILYLLFNFRGYRKGVCDR